MTKVDFAAVLAKLQSKNIFGAQSTFTDKKAKKEKKTNDDDEKEEEEETKLEDYIDVVTVSPTPTSVLYPFRKPKGKNPSCDPPNFLLQGPPLLSNFSLLPLPPTRADLQQHDIEVWILNQEPIFFGSLKVNPNYFFKKT